MHKKLSLQETKNIVEKLAKLSGASLQAVKEPINNMAEAMRIAVLGERKLDDCRHHSKGT